MIRLAAEADLAAVCDIYSDIHTEEENRRTTIGWIRGVYPTRATAEAALERGDLFVQEAEGKIVGTAIVNRAQVDMYRDGDWLYPAEDEEVMVLHTLVISPKAAGRGHGKAFVGWYEDYARENGCPILRMDTNQRNAAARSLYHKLGYREAGIVVGTFNGIPDVHLVLLEKNLRETP